MQKNLGTTVFQVMHQVGKVELDALAYWPPMPRVGPGHASPPCPFTSSSFPLFTFSFLSLALPIFFLLSIPSLSTSIVPLRFQAGGHRR